ncbi:MAG: hypothetical protein PHR15_06230 [Atopobiaceae bacterium]|nr:hypothetical protein [Atopobiaceae bacterium]MCH4181049.1 hypothetical protein [Atopobiaceae bacterium]MCH4213747.1 hypothetical protein [Atopobiaceae bacterium]MCH4230335.1 hypothetical protein [Atopobiaceae bacterium]MCH4277033.1 hypothetical protein [Atopobiaceae bacterium]
MNADKELARLLHEAWGEERLAVAMDRRLGRAVRRRVSQGRLVMPLRGLFYARADWERLGSVERTLFLARAFHVAYGPSMFCDVTAATAYGIEVTYRLLGDLHVCMSRTSTRSNRCGVRFHCVDGDDPCDVDKGLRVTSPARTVVDCARRLGIPEGVVIADSALHKGIVTRDELDLQLMRMRRSTGIGNAREVVRLSNGLAESGGETLARLLFERLGYAAPELQVVVTSPMNGETYRVDFCWTLPDGSLVLGELDGHEKHVNPDMTHGETPVEVLERERLRESYLTATGARVMRFSYADLLDERHMRTLLDAFEIPRRTDS